MMQDNHIFQGMNRATHPIKQDKSFLWDAHNIRLTTRDKDTMLSITNERSTEEIIKFPENETYIGHVVLGDYLVVLIHGNEEYPSMGDIQIPVFLIYDRIYRVNLSSEKKNLEILFTGNLNLDPSYPAQMIGDYESEFIQKVYWVDGRNSPRVINIAKPELTGAEYNEERGYTDIYTDKPFGFVQYLELNEDVSVTRQESSIGLFSSGVVQYALTYLHKYGQESNIFYVSEPLYLSYADRGGSPEDRISASFEITVNNIDTKFQYIRVYSIVRTSIDATPTVKRVTDVNIEKASSGSVTILDNNTTGDIVDPTYLLYVGGSDIIANCIASKDNTLFLGNISYQRTPIYKSEAFNGYLTDKDNEGNTVALHLDIPVDSGTRAVELPVQDTKFNYVNQLQKNTCTFKRGETYRLGCRFQYITGEWSEPIWIKDHIHDTDKGITYSYDGTNLTIGKISSVLPKDMVAILTEEGYKKVQPLICKPSYNDRTIIAQGIVCPTVGQVGNRKQRSGAYAQSSWLLRPWNAKMIVNGTYQGNTPACTHDLSLSFGKERSVEVQTMAMTWNENGVKNENAQLTYNEMADAKKDDGTLSEAYYSAFVVDQSIVTMYSPDIEFGDIRNILNSEAPLSVHKVGEVKFDSNIGNISIQTSTPVADPDASGFLERSLSGEGKYSLISGLFYEDAMLDDQDGGDRIVPYGDPRLWLTYLWHRTGSLNNDCVRPEGVGTRTSELKKKTILNYKNSSQTIFSNQSELPKADIKPFNSNEVTLTRIKLANGETVTYYGNIDTLIPAYAQYEYVCTAIQGVVLKDNIPALSGKVYVGGEEKTFGNLKIKNATGTKTSVTSNNITAGQMPYTIDTTTTITNSSGTSSESGETSDSSTTVSSSGTKVIMVNITGKAQVSLNISKGEFSGSISLTQNALADDGKTTVPNGYTWSINGKTNYTPQFEKHKDSPFGSKHPTWRAITPTFTVVTQTLTGDGTETGSIRDSDDVGDNYDALRMSKDGVRMKYKSAPHAVISLQSPLTQGTEGSLYLVEIRQTPTLRYGGNTEEAIKNNLWIPAGPAKNLIGDGKHDTPIEWLWGDTWFQKYEFLKTYPFTFEDINQVTEIGSFYCETRMNIDGRYDRNRGSNSFNLSPANFNLINPVYSQLDTFFTSRKLDDDYYKIKEYPSQFFWTETKIPSSETDLWTNLHMASSYDMDGSNGKITAIQPYSDMLLGFQDRAVSQILFNSRVQIQASDGIPIEIANSQKVEGVRLFSNTIGCQDKFNIVPSSSGVYFVDNNNSTVYRFNGEINNIGSQLGNLFWFRENFQNNTWMFRSDKGGNPGIRLYYDPKYQDVYFVPSLTKDSTDRDPIHDSLCFSERLNQFSSMMSYNGAVMFPFESKFYSLANDSEGVLTLWENFAGDGYNIIFDIPRPFNFSFISNDNPSITKIFDTIEMRTDRYEDETLLGDKYSTKVQEGQPLDFIKVTNEYQDTEEQNFNGSTLRKKFRIWRAIVPRNNKRERIRNPWSKITLGCKKPSTDLTILHDLSVKYTI